MFRKNYEHLRLGPDKPNVTLLIFFAVQGGNLRIFWNSNFGVGGIVCRPVDVFLPESNFFKSMKNIDLIYPQYLEYNG